MKVDVKASTFYFPYHERKTCHSQLHPDHCSQLPAIFRFLVADSGTSLLSARSVRCRQDQHRCHSFLLYHCRSLHAPLFRLSAGYLFQKATLSIGLLLLYGHVRRLHAGRHIDSFHHLPDHSWLFFRNGYGQR